MARQSGRQYDVPWDNIMDDRIYNKKGHQSDSEQAGTDIGTFGRRSTNSNRANRNSDYLQLMDYQAGGSRYSLNDPSVAYDNMAYPSQDQFPAGRYKKHRTLSESTSGRCNRPCLIGVVVIVLVTALVAAGVGLYFGVFRHETTQVTPSPTTLKVYATELRLTDLSWSSRLEDPTSPEFVIMKDNVLSDMDKIMRHSSLQTKYQSAEVLGFSSGSIKAKLLLKILTDALSAIDVKTSFVHYARSANTYNCQTYYHSTFHNYNTDYNSNHSNNYNSDYNHHHSNNYNSDYNHHHSNNHNNNSDYNHHHSNNYNSDYSSHPSNNYNPDYNSNHSNNYNPDYNYHHSNNYNSDYSYHHSNNYNSDYNYNHSNNYNSDYNHHHSNNQNYNSDYNYHHSNNYNSDYNYNHSNNYNFDYNHSNNYNCYNYHHHHHANNYYYKLSKSCNNCRVDNSFRLSEWHTGYSIVIPMLQFSRFHELDDR
ncbi:hypothetical protein KP79_PYT17426 [Mizuhopecten yessoensis]|uniref:SEA domain-containing protein n=1 Tax=Mizuhopecten yessoensis TaxID=6573 RepID=A0A210QSQ0_MIZYE|nr:hypothetical protein KP79_PYT17426 [Mizuhopecten yessoensis]